MILSRKDRPPRPQPAPGWVVEQPPHPPRSKLRSALAAVRPSREPRDVRAVLVAELATNFWPSVITAGTFVTVGLFAGVTLHHGAMLAVTALGACFALAKMVVIALHRRAVAAGDPTDLDGHDARKWDRLHTLSGAGFAAAVGALGAMIFAGHDRVVQMLATGLLFAYCSGIVARVSIRPGSAMAFLLLAAVPLILSSAAHVEPAHWLLAGMFAVFLGAALESILHLHSAASEQIALRLDMTSLARADPLTGLQNRLGLRQAFRGILQSRRTGTMLAVHCFDLDRFKPVNDRYGHPVGDLMLKQVGERLRGLLGDGSVAARIGGDEFVVVQYPLQQAAEADLFARRLSRAITAPYRIGELTIEIGVSLGYATAPPGAYELDALFAQADVALYRMKLSGGGVSRAG
uniref:diguanylate cyclase domain-containing protein n=1 Tax=uncultured Sphingomonas sp. TaxID=158754 RepID=UPI0035CC9025